MIQPTENELSEVLLEFHQRNQGQIVKPGPPPPFEISVAVQPFPMVTEAPNRRQEVPPLIPPDSALVRKEDEVDFGMIQVIPWQPGQRLGTYGLIFNFKCHNQDTVSEECYIRTYNNYWVPQDPGNTRCTPPIPIVGGRQFVTFYGSTWTPTHNNQYVQCQVVLDNMPQCPAERNFQLFSYTNFWVQRVSDGSEMRVIYGTGTLPPPQTPWWTWTYPTADPGVIQAIIWAFA